MPSEPRALSWEQANAIWEQQRYVANNEWTGDEVRQSTEAWDRAFEAVDLEERDKILRWRNRQA